MSRENKYLLLVLLGMLAMSEVAVTGLHGADKPAQQVSPDDSHSPRPDRVADRVDQVPMLSEIQDPEPGDETQPGAQATAAPADVAPLAGTRAVEHVAAAVPTGHGEEQAQLSERVFRVIREIQWLQMHEQWEEALNEMNALYAEFDTLSKFEQMTLLNFYTNTLITLEMWQEAIAAFSRILTIPDLTPEFAARTLRSLGQLHTQAGDSQAAIGYYEQWLQLTAGQEGVEAQTQRVRQQLDLLRGER